MADREAFEAWLCTLPAGAQQNIRDAHARGESLTAAAWQAAVAQTARECAQAIRERFGIKE